jgi:sodium/potassium-transporting ATPase subunit alpha
MLVSSSSPERRPPALRIDRLSEAEALASLASGPEGLSRDEARRRLGEFGPNRIEEVRREPVLLRLLREFVHFFAVILWVAAGLAFFAEWSAPGQGMAKLGVAIVVVIVVSGVFSFWQEYRAERILALLRQLLPQQVAVLRGGKVVQVPRPDLVPGDIVLLEQGDRVPADCRLIEAFGVRVDDALISGESVPRSRVARRADGGDLIHGKNIVLAGASLVSGQARAVVFATGVHTEFGRIAHLTQTAGEIVSPLRAEIARLSRVIGIVAVAIGAVFFGVGRFVGVPFWNAFIFAIGIIVAMVPEGLLPTLTLALVLASQRMAKRNVLIRHLSSVETLGSTTVICTDKTGTLTQNRMVVRELIVGLQRVPVDGAVPGGALVAEHAPLFLGAALCQDLRAVEQEGRTVLLGDPMEVALVELANRTLPGVGTHPRLDEVPFDADRMRLSTVNEMPSGPALWCKGAPESVVPLCDRIHQDGAARPLTPELRARIAAAHEDMAERGLRVLAFAHRALEPGWEHEGLEQRLVLSGLVGLEDPPRPEVHGAIRKCREAGIRVIMVSGDHPRTARAIAREVGLIESEAPLVWSGEELAALTDTQLSLALDAPEILFARVRADQKRRIVEALKAKKHVVAVTGDGVNDAPALKSAHIGIAMGRSGSDVAKEASDMVLLDDNFASIVNAIEEGRAVFANIRKFLTYILAHNVPELVPYLAFSLFAIPLPLTPIQILAIDMGTDSLTALGLGVEKPDPRLMRVPPRPPQERLFDWALAGRAYLFLGLIEAVAALAAFFFVLRAAGWSYGAPLGTGDPLYLHATTACFSAIIAMQIVNVFLCRSPDRSLWSTGLLGNPLILYGALLEVALVVAIDYTSLGNALFGTAPIGSEVWLFVAPFAAAMLVLEELRKLAVRSAYLR